MEVLRIVDVAVRTGLNAVDDTGLKIEENGAGNIPSIIGLEGRQAEISTSSTWRVWNKSSTDLVKEYILSISSFSREILQVTILVDTVLLT